MKVTYLSQYASTSRVGMIVRLDEVQDGEAFEVLEDSREAPKGFKGWRQNNWYNALTQNRWHGRTDVGFFGSPDNQFDLPNKTLIIERTP